RQRRLPSSVLEDGECIYLLDNANLSTGGDAVDVTADLHPEFRELAIRITRDMGLRLCGVDIITPDARLPVNQYVLLEINGAPGLDNYASIGELQAEIVDGLYLKILQALERGLAARPIHEDDFELTSTSSH